MKIKFNKKEILKNIGIECTNDIDYIAYITRLIDELEQDNKNYTKKQYYKILDIKEILYNLTIEE